MKTHFKPFIYFCFLHYIPQRPKDTKLIGTVLIIFLILVPLQLLITILNNFIFPLNGGYFIAGSNQVGVFIIAFLWLNVSKEYLP